VLRRRLLLGACGSCVGLAGADAPGPWQFLHNGPESADDRRYDYHWQVLRAALEATRAEFGGYTLEPVSHMTESRQVLEMQRPGGLINTLVLDSTRALERQLMPVKVPVDKGLLGYRLFLIRARDQARFSQVRTLDELRRFVIGQQADWADVAIYRAAGFTVVGSSAYRALFPMLMAGRFDALGRGVTEVEQELAAQRQRFPGMRIESELLLHYPLAVYFWFAPSDEGRRRWQRVSAGMRQISADGTLDRLFKREFGEVVARLGLRERRLLEIPNPLLPAGQPFEQTGLWFDPRR